MEKGDNIVAKCVFEGEDDGHCYNGFSGKAKRITKQGRTTAMGLLKPRGKHIRAAGDTSKVVETAEDQTVVAQGGQGSQTAPTDGKDVPEGDGQEAELGSEPAGFVAAGFADVPQKRRRGLRAFGITMGVLIGVLCIAYIAGAIVFMGRFLPHTTIGDHDISLKTNEEVIELLDDSAARYRINAIGNGLSYRMTSSDIGLSIDAAAVVSDMHEDLNAWAWPMLIVQQGHDESDQLRVDFDRSAYEPDVTAIIEAHNETASPPVNATIVYDEKNDRFVVKPEQIGSQFNAEAVLDALADAISTMQPKLVLTERELVQPTVFATDEKLINSAELATGLVSAKLSLVMGGQPVGEVGGDALSGFITIDENLEVTFREDDLDAWVGSLADSFNTVDTERTYTRADGKQITVAGGVYGWEVDTAALKAAILEGVRAGAVSEIEVPCIDTAAVYNGPHQRDWGNRYIDVDVSEQYVRFYGDDGAIIWESACITGRPDGMHDTWPGVWRVNAKESPSKLIGYEYGKKIYETSVTYWMPFEGNGIGFHDATWQPSFGGSMYANGYGSHGCVNLSSSAAQSLYDIIAVGDVVVVHS